jgi:hypothetical protein
MERVGKLNTEPILSKLSVQTQFSKSTMVIVFIQGPLHFPLPILRLGRKIVFVFSTTHRILKRGGWNLRRIGAFGTNSVHLTSKHSHADSQPSSHLLSAHSQFFDDLNQRHLPDDTNPILANTRILLIKEDRHFLQIQFVILYAFRLLNGRL